MRIAKHYRSRFTTVVGFAPTGWSHAQSRGKASLGKRRQKGTLITYQVCVLTTYEGRMPATLLTTSCSAEVGRHDAS